MDAYVVALGVVAVALLAFSCGFDFGRKAKRPETLWVVGQFKAETDDGTVWDFQGLHETRRQALACCRDWNYFLAPVYVGVETPHVSTAWPGAEYPHASAGDTVQRPE